MALRCALLRCISSPVLGNTGVLSSRKASLPVKNFFARRFAEHAVNDTQSQRQDALQRLTEAFMMSWEVRAIVKSVAQSLPLYKGKRFYNRRVVESLEQGDLDRAWAVVVTLHQRHIDKVVLWPYTYNLLLRHYCKQQKTLMDTNLTQILALLDFMVAQGCADQASFEVAMAACSRARHLRSARRVLEKMNECGSKPNAQIYGFLINCCARKQGFVETAERYYAEMLTARVKPTILVINAMLRVYSRDRGRSTMMLDLLSRARDDFGLVSNAVTTRTMVYYLLREGDVKKAMTYMHCIESESSFNGSRWLQVNRQVVNSLIDACRQQSDWKSAQYALGLLQLIDEKDAGVRSKDALNTSTMLANLVQKCDNSSPALVWALSEQNWSRTTRPNQKALFLSQSQKESVERALERIECTCVPESHSLISRLSLNVEGKLRVLDDIIRTKRASVDDFNAVLEACGIQGRLADAKTVLKKMENYAELLPQCAPSTRSYNALLSAIAARGDVHEIESVVNDMIANKLQPDQMTINTVLKAHTSNLRNINVARSKKRLNTVVQALLFFKWCVKAQKLEPDASTYKSLFRLFTTYIEISDDSSVAVAFRTAIFDDVKKEEQDYTEGQEREMIAWITGFIATTCRDAPTTTLDIGVFNNAFDYYRRLGAVDKSLELFELMSKRGFQPNNATLGLLFATCASQQQFEKGLKILDNLMTIDGYKPTLEVLTGAMQLCANAKNLDGVLKIFRAIEASSAFTLTIKTYEPVVFAYARVGNVAGTWLIADEMEKKLGKVSINIYNYILLACVEAAQPGRALELFSVVRLRKNVTLDVVSYNTAIEAFVRAGERASWWRKNSVTQPEEVEDLNDEEIRSAEKGNDAKADQYSDDRKEHVAIFDDLAQTTEVDGDQSEETSSQNFEYKRPTKAPWVRASVFGLLEEMQKNRVKPDMTTFERAIAACSVNEDFEGVIAIFDKLIYRKRHNNASDLKSKLVSTSSFTAYLKACTAMHDKHRIIEAPELLHKWHLATGQIPPDFVVTQLLESLETMSEWRCAVRMLPEWQVLFGAPPGIGVFNKVMEMCNRAGEHQLVAPIFVTMQDTTAYRITPDAESYIQRIYAEEQQENWVVATDLFVEMKKRFSYEEISHRQLKKLNLGRYSLRNEKH